MIYLDNSATTILDAEVLEAMLPWLREDFGNASSAHFLGRRARVAVEAAREEIASLLHAHPAELIFTSGGTESNNTILKSCVDESGLVSRIACSSIEHHAVLAPLEELGQKGVQTRILPVDNDGRVQLEDVGELNSPKSLVSVMHVNNEIGTIQDLFALRAALPSALIHSDMVQSLGKVEINLPEMGVDFASFSAHKLHGPKGIGAMFIRRGIDFKAHQQGGGQERNRRAGTEAVALIVGFQVAVRKALENFRKSTELCVQRIQVLREELLREIPSIRINSPASGSAPHILNISFLDAESLDGDAILQLMDMRGIAVSNGSACVSGTMQPSHVLLAMGRSAAEAKAAIRFSLSRDTTHDEVLQAARSLSDILHDMREV